MPILRASCMLRCTFVHIAISDTKSAFFTECLTYMWPSVNPLRQMKVFETEYTKALLSQEVIDVLVAISDKNVEKFTQFCVSTFDKNHDGSLSEQEFNETVSYLVKLLVSIKYSKD